MTIEARDLIYSDFIRALVALSNGKINKESAIIIAEKKFKKVYFADGSPLTHKGPRWLAKRVLRSMGILE